MNFGKSNKTTPGSGDNGSQSIIIGGSVHRMSARDLKQYMLLGLVTLVLIAVVYFFWKQFNDQATTNKAANATAQLALQTNLAKDEAALNQPSIAHDATALINGKLSGIYTIDNKDLAQYYMEAATALYNLKEYSQAITYYKIAPKYDNSMQQAALQGEVTAGYDAGQRQQLIPLLNQLVALTKNDQGWQRSLAPQYQYDITAIQHNQRANL